MTETKDPHDANDQRGVNDPQDALAQDLPPGPDADPAPDEDAAGTEDTLTAEERRERDHLIKEGRAKLRRGYLADIEFGRILRKLIEKRLYREGGMTKQEFCLEKFDLTDESVDQYIAFADLHDAFEGAGVEPLMVKSHVTALLPLPTLDDQVHAALRGRELAEAEGKRLAARHLKAARVEIEAEVLGESEAANDPGADVKEEVRTRGGLHIVLSEGVLREGAAATEAAQPYLPGRVIAPYEELPELEARAVNGTTDSDTDAAESAAEAVDVATTPTSGANASEKLTRADLDEVAEFVLFVLARDAWEPALAWTLPAGDFRATYHPDRLSAPSTPVTSDKTREANDRRSATLRVAPGVDLLHPDLPEPVLRAVVEAAGTDPQRRYLFLTKHPARAAEVEWTPNSFVCVTGRDAASVTEMAAVAEGAGVRFVLVLRDAVEALPAEALQAFAWVLIRGKKTSQAAYESVFRAVPFDRVQVGREVHARPLGYARVLPEQAEAGQAEAGQAEAPTKRRSTRPVAVKAVRDPKTGVLLPPGVHAPPMPWGASTGTD